MYNDDIDIDTPCDARACDHHALQRSPGIVHGL
jgi:hypothetical protein